MVTLIFILCAFRTKSEMYVKCLLQGGIMHGFWSSVHEYCCLPSNITPWTKSYKHLIRQYPNSQKKPIDFPKNTELWLSCTTRFVVKDSTFMKQKMWKCFASYQWQDGAVLVPRNMVVPWFWGHHEPNRPFCGCGFCFCFSFVVIKHAYDNSWRLHVSQRKKPEEEGRDEIPTVE